MEEEKEIHLRDYLKIIVKRRQLAFTFFGVVFALSLILTLSSTPLYMATTKVLIEKSEPNNLAMMNMYYTPYDPEFYETQYQLIKSTSVAQKVVKVLNLDKTYSSYFREKGEGFNIVGGTIAWFRDVYSTILNVAGMTGQAPPDPAGKDAESELQAKTDRIAKTIAGSIIVTPIKNSKLVNISYLSANPEFAALIVNSVAKAYIEDLLDMKMTSSRYAMRWLTEKAEEERVKLEKSEEALQEYTREKDIVTLENRIAMVPEKLSEVATKIAAAETKRKEMESLYNSVKDLSRNPEKADTIPAIGSDPTIQSLRLQIFKSEQNISDMSKKYGRKHPAMITAMNDLKGLKDKKDQEIKRVIESIKNEYELAKANEENFRKMASQTKADTLNLNEKFIQYGALKREAETNKQLFDAIIKKIKEQDITQDIQTVNVWVVEKAEVPKSPAKPNKARNILLGLIVGLLGGIGLTFFVEYLDNTIKSVEDTEAKLGVPVLGVVTLLKDKGKSMDQIVRDEPQSAFAESYKVLRTAILLSSAVNPPKNILITSISPGEGKTVTSVNLAMTIAQSEHKVLLVDSDLRKPRIHKIFGMDNSRGLSTYLAGASDMDIIGRDVVPNLSIIPSGPIPPNPSELLSSGKMFDLLKRLNELYDIVIWDAAPLLTVTDSLILSKILDGTIIVTKAGETTYENVGRGMKSLHDIEAHFLGVVINALDVRHSDYYYHRYYNYGSGEKDASK
ncbi:MAG: polysaccharide biosynthesis tyrosine autokinase [Nitrospiraceae bacterium]|nr:polysaccharide biosynthesis tyrosine autokinase [Nitrospiraceae bacterium]